MTADANSLTVPATQVPAVPPSPAVQFRAWVDAFELLGYDVGRLLADVGIERSALADPDLLISCDVVGALIARTQQIRPLKNLWTKLGAVTPLGAIPLLDYQSSRPILSAAASNKKRGTFGSSAPRSSSTSSWTRIRSGLSM